MAVSSYSLISTAECQSEGHASGRSIVMTGRANAARHAEAVSEIDGNTSYGGRMRTRIGTLGGLTLVLVVAVGLLDLAQVGLNGQTATGIRSDEALRTPWGEPDLQGIWTEEVDIPLERPERYGNREVFTDEEYAEVDNTRARLLADQTTGGGDRRSAPGSQNDVAGAYSNAYLTFKHLGRRTSLIVDPQNGRIPPLTAEAQAIAVAEREFQLALLRSTETCRSGLAACEGGEYSPTPSPRRSELPPRYNTNAINRYDNPGDGTPSDRCLAGSIINFTQLFATFGGNFRRIVQTQGGVSMYYDVGQGQGFQRNIVMNGSPHLPDTIRQWFGDSRGHWEGDTLVIDVTNFSPKHDFRGSRENMHLVERWTRTGQDTLEYEVTIEDPTVWVRPWTVRQEFRKQSDQENRIYYEPRCHEGNYGFPALLQGSRIEEQEYAAGRGPHPATFDNRTGSGITRFPGGP